MKEHAKPRGLYTVKKRGTGDTTPLKSERHVWVSGPAAAGVCVDVCWPSRSLWSGCHHRPCGFLRACWTGGQADLTGLHGPWGPGRKSLRVLRSQRAPSRTGLSAKGLQCQPAPAPSPRQDLLRTVLPWKRCLLLGSLLLLCTEPSACYFWVSAFREAGYTPIFSMNQSLTHTNFPHRNGKSSVFTGGKAQPLMVVIF